MAQSTNLHFRSIRMGELDEPFPLNSANSNSEQIQTVSYHRSTRRCWGSIRGSILPDCSRTLKLSLPVMRSMIARARALASSSTHFSYRLQVLYVFPRFLIGLQLALVPPLKAKRFPLSDLSSFCLSPRLR